MTAARGIRNRNPGNIVVSGWTQRQEGYLGPEPEGRFARFDTMANGVQALMRLLMVYRDEHKLKTVRGIINRWAPPVENDTSSYVLTVARVLGVDPDSLLPATAEVYTDLAKAIVMHENGRDQAVAVTDEDYEQAATKVFMQTASATQPSAPPQKTPLPPAPSIGERIVAIPALVTAAASALIPIIADLMRARGSKTSERNAEVVESVAPIIVEVARQVVPAAKNEQEAAETILASKELQDQFKGAMAVRWSDVKPFLEFEEESRGKARQWMAAMTSEGPTWKQVGAGLLLAFLSLLVLAGGGWMLREVLLHATTDQQTKGLIIGFLISAATMVLSYFFGSSASSKVSGQALQEIAKGK